MRRPLPAAFPQKLLRASFAPLWIALVAAAALAAGATARPAAARIGPTPVLAYYYIWFNTTSWNRAKRDYPVLGRYSSDEAATMRQHVLWAKRAGIDGFIVSWKDREALNRRLDALSQIADEEGFKLAVIYQGLDFERRPLPASRVGADLGAFLRRFSQYRAYRLFGRPLVIWSGTWKFSRRDVARVVGPYRERLLILASEKNVRGYERLADLVDGDAYYWSSVDPQTFPGYPQKLEDMGRAVHGRRGLWIAPAAPGFDARQIGGTRVVSRRGGATLRRQIAGAIASTPDAVGLISWNEFSENTHIEPSRNHGFRYLNLVAELSDGHPVAPVELDSSASPATGVGYGLPLLAGVVAVAAAGVAALAFRGRPRSTRAGSATG